MNRSPIVVPGLLSLGLYLFAALRLEASNSARDVFGFLALFGILFLLYGFAFWRSDTLKLPSARQILIFAVLFRLVMLFAGLPPGRTLEGLKADLSGERVGYDTFLLYDNDLWRYLWDGHVLGSGMSPFETTPRQIADAAGPTDGESPLESELWWDILDNISYQSYTTVYPPLAQALFALSHRIRPGSVFVLKLLITVADLATCLLLAAWIPRLGRPPHYLLLYAWNPLAIKEFSGSGHIDALMVALVVASIFLLSRGRSIGSQLGLVAATLSKVGALAVAPIVWLRSPREHRWVLPVGFLIAGLALFDPLRHLLAGLSVYAEQWTFNSGLWAALRQILDWLGVERASAGAHLVTRALSLAIIAWGTWYVGDDPRRLVRAVFLVLAALVLLNSAVMPWYLLWALPFAALLGNRSWCLLTGLSLLSYLIYYFQSQQAWWLWVQYGVFALCLAAELRRRSPEA